MHPDRYGKWIGQQDIVPPCEDRPERVDVVWVKRRMEFSLGNRRVIPGLYLFLAGAEGGEEDADFLGIIFLDQGTSVDP